MRLELGKLEVFRAVVREGGYSAAARRLHLTPSAVSHAMARLRASLGCELFQRRGRQLALTREGELLYQVCQRVFDELEEVDRRLRSGGAEAALRLVLGSTVEFGSRVLLPRMRSLLQAHPSLQIDFHLSNELLQPLLRDEIDLAVDCKPHTHPAVRRQLLFREKYVLVAAPGFLERYPIRTPLDLRRTPVLSLDREGTWWDNLTSSLPDGRRPTLEHVVTINNVRGMINAAIAEYGVGLLPKYALLDELASGALVVLFPRLKLLEDSFAIYQKIARAERPANAMVTRFLLGLDIRDFGDAIGPRR